MNRKTMASAAMLAVAALILAPAQAATLLVANKSDDTVDLVSRKSGQSQATLPTGHAPHEVATSPDGRLAVVANYGDRGGPGSTLTVIDVPRAEVLGTVELGRHQLPHGLVWYSESELAVTTEGSAHLLVVNPREAKIVKEIETSARVSHMVAVTPDGGRAFVANIGSGSVTAIDLARGVKLGDIETGAGAEGIAVTPDGREVWVTNRAADTISVIDSETLEVKADLPCAGFPIRIAITPDGKRALVSSARSGEVVLFDVATRKELLRKKLDFNTVPEASKRLFGDRFGESPVPVGLVVAPDGKTAWVAATQADVVAAIDPATLEVRDLIRAGQEPDGMALSAIAVKKNAD
jgi:YVTN family beta-propeller protein